MHTHRPFAVDCYLIHVHLSIVLLIIQTLQFPVLRRCANTNGIIILQVLRKKNSTSGRQQYVHFAMKNHFFLRMMACISGQSTDSHSFTIVSVHCIVA